MILSVSTSNEEGRVLLFDGQSGKVFLAEQYPVHSSSPVDKIVQTILKAFPSIRKVCPPSRRLVIETRNTSVINKLGYSPSSKKMRELQGLLATLPIEEFEVLVKSNPRAKSYNGYATKKKEKLVELSALDLQPLS